MRPMQYRLVAATLAASLAVLAVVVSGFYDGRPAQAASVVMVGACAELNEAVCSQPNGTD